MGQDGVKYDTKLNRYLIKYDRNVDFTSKNIYVNKCFLHIYINMTQNINVWVKNYNFLPVNVIYLLVKM